MLAYDIISRKQLKFEQNPNETEPRDIKLEAAKVERPL
jgi:hypothetical protein